MQWTCPLHPLLACGCNHPHQLCPTSFQILRMPTSALGVHTLLLWAAVHTATDYDTGTTVPALASLEELHLEGPCSSQQDTEDFLAHFLDVRSPHCLYPSLKTWEALMRC